MKKNIGICALVFLVANLVACGNHNDWNSDIADHETHTVSLERGKHSVLVVADVDIICQMYRKGEAINQPEHTGNVCRFNFDSEQVEELQLVVSYDLRSGIKPTKKFNYHATVL